MVQHVDWPQLEELPIKPRTAQQHRGIAAARSSASPRVVHARREKLIE
jgi:hypothetical protein